MFNFKAYYIKLQYNKICNIILYKTLYFKLQINIKRTTIKYKKIKQINFKLFILVKNILFFITKVY